MADVSLDEVIRRRGINLKASAKRPTFGWGAGGPGGTAGTSKSFDARQKIGVNDVRQRLGGGTGFEVKDAREKLAQKDARFKIRGRGGGGAGVQDARQMINSRKQGPNPFAVPPQTMLKTAVTHQLQGHTLVPQIQIHAGGVNTRQFGLGPNAQVMSMRGSVTPQLSNNKRMMDARDRLSLKRSIGGTQTAAAPPMKITKTIQQRPVGMPGGIRATTQPAFSPLEGTKITVNNLHPRVTEEDIVELFCVCGALKRARLVKVGVAEVVFVRKEDAVSAYRKYNNRCLDGIVLCVRYLEASTAAKRTLSAHTGSTTTDAWTFSADSAAQHDLYVKEHKVRAATGSHRPLDRTLFVLNVPPYCSQATVRELFSRFGGVQSVELRDHPGSFQESGPELTEFFKPAEKKGFKVGYVVFQSASSLAAAKSHPHDVPLVVCTEGRPVRTGVQSEFTSLSLLHLHETSTRVLFFILSQAEERQKKEAEQQEEDDEGWVKVTRGHNGAKARPHSEAANRRTLQKEIRKKKRKELINFYTWQHKNTQKEHIAELRKKFEEDKQRIALLRAQRKFRPY
ncbi:hypothetical protein F2P81_014692 [Scophthalmus maximus]|uniref:RRM domain-containing protein n=1 Tax=Scophthalmus maximus TaxID=52904 RepID=A0A6A4SQ00_SCOMX|nr:hypothetical protein F2P81_014692 [Scophthalmus maximus]